MSSIVKFVELPDGVRLPCAECGDPSGTPVILLHGVTDSWRSFEPVLPHLPSSIHAFALTQRGHGDASRPPNYRSADFAADLVAFMDAMSLEQAIIVGHSMGSANALRFAVAYPERVLGLVLGGAFFDFRSNPAVIEFWETAVSALEDPIDPVFAREFQQSTLTRSIPQSFMDTVVQESLKVPARVWRAVFQGFVDGDSAVDLGRIRIPTLICWGDQDSFCPRSDQDSLLAAIAGSRLLVYPGVGHALHWEEPERFANDVAAFVERVTHVDQSEEVTV